MRRPGGGQVGIIFVNDYHYKDLSQAEQRGKGKRAVQSVRWRHGQAEDDIMIKSSSNYDGLFVCDQATVQQTDPRIFWKTPIEMEMMGIGKGFLLLLLLLHSFLSHFSDTQLLSLSRLFFARTTDNGRSIIFCNSFRHPTFSIFSAFDEDADE